MTVWRGLSAAVRGVGATLDAIGASMQGHLAPREALMPPINRLTFQGMSPTYPQHSFVAPNAAVIGNVTLGPRSSVWYGATLRGDVNAIKVGHTTNIQDRVVVHVAKHNAEGQSRDTVIGDKVLSLAANALAPLADLCSPVSVLASCAALATSTQGVILMCVARRVCA